MEKLKSEAQTALGDLKKTAAMIISVSHAKACRVNDYIEALEARVKELEAELAAIKQSMAGRVLARRS